MLENQLPQERTSQIIMHLEDVLSLAKWTNRRDKYRNIGNKLDSTFIPVVGGVSFLTLSATIGTTIFSSINETIGTIGGIGSGLAGLFAFTRLPNILYGNGRFHAHSRGRKLAKDVYAFTKIYDRKVRVERLVAELIKNGESFTPAEWKHINDVISNIKSTLKTMTDRQKNRKEVSTYNKFYQKLQEKRENEGYLDKISREFAKKRLGLWEKVKYPDLLARASASKELEKIMGSAWEKLSWLIDPKSKKESITTNTEEDTANKTDEIANKTKDTVNYGQYTFTKDSNGLLIPENLVNSGNKSIDDESSSHKKVSRGEWDEDVINGIIRDFNYLDFAEYMDVLDKLLADIQKLAPKTKQIPNPPKPRKFSVISRRSRRPWRGDEGKGAFVR